MEFEKAKKIYKQELIKNPQNFETINLLSIIYLQEKKYEKAKNEQNGRDLYAEQII